ncbi:MAG: ASKHA domain-containing protein [bacterium]
MSRAVTLRPARGRSLLALLADVGIEVASDCGGNGTCGKCLVRVQEEAGPRWVLACRFVPGAPVRVEFPAVRARGAGAAGRPRPARGRLTLALDLGTTALSLAAVEADSGRVVRRREMLNPQVAFGADVMTRIARAREVRCLDLLGPVREFAAEAGISPRRRVVAVGNTTMMHFLLGANPAGLGRWPYRSRLPLGREIRGRTVGEPALPVLVLPLLGGFVGADCTAAIAAAGMHRRRGLGLLVDAGTNGEIVLGDRDGILVCSTAAGPAFEGAALECGGLARPGAVRDVAPAGNGFSVRTVGNRPARAICGSGVLAAVAAALASQRLRRDGRIARGRRLLLADEVWLSQADLRAVQLAKSAVATGIRILLAERGARVTDIKRVFLAGRFGSAINPEHAVAIGLLPAGPPVTRGGNLALRGAVRAAVEPAFRRELAGVVRLCREVELSSHPDFEDRFLNDFTLARWES